MQLLRSSLFIDQHRVHARTSETNDTPQNYSEYPTVELSPSVLNATVRLIQKAGDGLIFPCQVAKYLKGAPHLTF